MNEAMLTTFKEHPLPWSAKHDPVADFHNSCDILDADASCIFTIEGNGHSSDVNLEIAETIVRCVNSKQELLPKV